MSVTIQLSDDWDADGWTLVPRAIIRDTNLSWKAKGLVAWLASHERGFSINREFIINAGPDGEEAVKTGLRELREAGYLSVERGRDDGGHLTSDAFYRLHRQPQNPRSEPNGGNPSSRENLQQGKPPGGKSGTKRDNSKERAQEQVPAAAASGPALHDVSPEAVAPLTLNQTATRLAQNHYERLGRMGNVPGMMKIVRKAIEHGYQAHQVDAACAYIADNRWTLTEERLANTLRGGARLPSAPPRINGRPTARTGSGMEIQTS